MGGIYGCGCKELYRLPQITFPYSSCICSFLQQHRFAIKLGLLSLFYDTISLPTLARGNAFL